MVGNQYLVTFERGDAIIAQEAVEADSENAARLEAAKRHPTILGSDETTKVRVSEVLNAHRT